MIEKLECLGLGKAFIDVQCRPLIDESSTKKIPIARRRGHNNNSLRFGPFRLRG